MIKVENADIKLACEMLISCAHTFCCGSADYHAGNLAKQKDSPALWGSSLAALPLILTLPAGGRPGMNRV